VTVVYSGDLTVHVAVAVTVFEDDLNNVDSEEAVVGVVHGGVPHYSVGARDDSWEPEDEMSPALVQVFWRGLLRLI
jgi:hypothetical protein